MKKKKPTNPTSTRYREGDQFIYHNFKDVMDKVEIQEIIPGGYRLSNGIMMNDSLQRIDQDARKYNYQILPWEGDSETLYYAFYARAYLLTQMMELHRELMQRDSFKMSKEEQERVIRIRNKFKKAIEK